MFEQAYERGSSAQGGIQGDHNGAAQGKQEYHAIGIKHQGVNQVGEAPVIGTRPPFICPPGKPVLYSYQYLIRQIRLMYPTRPSTETGTKLNTTVSVR